jgi:hypothetical protein
MTCEICERLKVEIILTDGEERQQLCSNCYNQIMSTNLGIELETQLEFFSITDYSGVRREFNIIQRIVPVGIFIEAVENKEHGYKFAVHGELECDQSKLFQHLLDKVKHGINTCYLTKHKFPNGQEIETIKNDKFVGRLEFDESNESTPLVIIDGNPYTWQQLGQMVSTFEGFQIQVKMVDMTDDLE